MPQLKGRTRVAEAAGSPAREPVAHPAPAPHGGTGEFDLPPQDPLHAFLLSQSGPVDIAALELSSPALASLREAGVVLVVPLVSSGELIGMLKLGPRLAERGHTSGRRR